MNVSFARNVNSFANVDVYEYRGYKLFNTKMAHIYILFDANLLKMACNDLGLIK